MFKVRKNFTWSAESDFIYVGSIGTSKVLKEYLIPFVEDLCMSLGEYLVGRVVKVLTTLQLLTHFTVKECILGVCPVQCVSSANLQTLTRLAFQNSV